jgi:hypothetical protein
MFFTNMIILGKKLQLQELKHCKVLSKTYALQSIFYYFYLHYDYVL